VSRKNINFRVVMIYLDFSRCEKCIWYESCKASNDLAEECDFFDNIIEEEDFWNEMSYRKFERSE
jgi:hypothetical protein